MRWQIGRWAVSALLSLVLSQAVFAQTRVERVVINGGDELPNGVPNYAQADFPGDNDCGPTAAGMLMGYHAASGWAGMTSGEHPYCVRQTDLNTTIPPSAGVQSLVRNLQYEMPYSSLGTWDAGQFVPFITSRYGLALTTVARRLDPTANWLYNDAGFPDQDQVRREILARRPMLMLVTLFQIATVWDGGSPQIVRFHWLPIIGYERQSPSGEFYLVMRSGWRRGGNSTLTYHWNMWDDLYTVDIQPGGPASVPTPHHVLLRETSGLTRVWVTDPAGQPTRWYDFRPPTGFEAVGFDKTSAFSARMLYSGGPGVARIVRLNQFFEPRATQDIVTGTAWTAKSLVGRGDGTSDLLWASGYGSAWIWRLDANGNTLSSRGIRRIGWTAQSFQTLSNGQARILWHDGLGRASIQTVDAAGAVVAEQVYGPWTGNTPTFYRVLSDGSARLLWQHGVISVLAPGGNSGLWYGPWSDRRLLGYTER